MYSWQNGSLTQEQINTIAVAARREQARELGRWLSALGRLLQTGVGRGSRAVEQRPRGRNGHSGAHA
mgnify:CR=1 FL=1